MISVVPDSLDTIAAVASPPGGAARGIIRISGPQTRLACEQFFDPVDTHAWQAARDAGPPRRHPGTWRIGNPERSLDVEVSLLTWPTSRSYTGQPSAEIHTMGSPPVLQRLLEDLLGCAEVAVRPARPGEFTLRAFLAGRIDLVQAEAVLGVIDADDHVTLEVALRQLAGGLSGQLATVRSGLLDLLADLEAGLDFADEDIEFVSRTRRQERLNAAVEQMTRVLGQAQQRMTTRTECRVALAGLPNAGKSALLNVLAGQPTAITSPRAGTTRDSVTTTISLEGLDMLLVDTAGWESSTDMAALGEIDRLAQYQRADDVLPADLIVWCVTVPDDQAALDDHRERDAVARAEISERGVPLLVAVTRADLLEERDVGVETLAPAPDAVVSARTGQGLDRLRARLVEHASGAATVGAGSDAAIVGSTAARTIDALKQSVSCLRAAAENDDELLAAVELREALEQLGRVMGTVYTDDILDRVFSKFCIGK